MDKPISELEAGSDVRAMTDAIQNSPTIRQLQKHIDRLAISADAKALLCDLGRLSMTVGDAVLQVGRRIVGFILDLAKRFPNTAFGVVVGVVLTMLIAAVPFIGPFLAGFLGPLMIAFGLTVGAVRDMGDASLRARMAALECEFRAMNPAAGG